MANALDSGEPGEMLIAISLRDGKRLWSRSIRSGVPRLEVTPLVGDFDGDERKTVVFIGMLSDTQADRNCEVRAFDGRDGALRWTWNPNAEFVLSSQTSAQMVVAKFAGRGKQNVCVRCLSRERTQWIVILDGGGTECARGRWPAQNLCMRRTSMATATTSYWCNRTGGCTRSMAA